MLSKFFTHEMKTNIQEEIWVTLEHVQYHAYHAFHEHVYLFCKKKQKESELVNGFKNPNEVAK